VQGLDVDAGDLHGAVLMPVFRSRLPSASTSARMRSEAFADGLLDGRVTLVTGGGTGAREAGGK
jgi:hypothetical protein